MDGKVLITGGTGFIGLHLARRLTAEGAQVTLVDNLSRTTVDQDFESLLPTVNFVEHDLTIPLSNEISDDYDQVYHFAAVVGVNRANEAPHHVLRTNVLTAANVLERCASMKRPTVCFASSSEAYAASVQAGLAIVPTPETVPLLIPQPDIPRSSYGASKIIGELLCLSYARAFAFPLRMVRFHNVYGPRMGYDHVIPQFIGRALKRRDPFDIYGATQTRAYCFVDDAVEATLRLMSLPDLEPVLANVGNDREEVDSRLLARMVTEVAGYKPSFSVHAPPVGSPEHRRPDLSRLRRLTGYQPRIALAEGVRLTYEWYSRRDRDEGLQA